MQKVCFDIYWHCLVMWCSGAVRLMTSNNDSVVRVFDCNNFSVLKSFYFPWAVNVWCTFSVSCRSGSTIFYQAIVLDENPFFCSGGLAVPCSSRWPLWDFSKRNFQWFMLWHCFMWLSELWTWHRLLSSFFWVNLLLWPTAPLKTSLWMSIHSDNRIAAAAKYPLEIRMPSFIREQH